MTRLPLPVRLAFRALPEPFRDAFAAEMAEDYREARAACVTRRAVLALVLATTLDVLASGLRERRSPTVRPWPTAEGPTRRANLAGEAWRDLRQAVRGLARRPGFAAVAILTLGLGIGANTAVFSVVDAVLLRSLEWNEPESLVRVYVGDGPQDRNSMSLPDVLDIAALPAYETLVGYREGTATVTGGEEPELVASGRATDGLMRTFRVQPYIGRDLTAEDAENGRPWVAVVGYEYWQTRLGGRPDVLGATIEISDTPMEIVGVAPPDFDFPDHAQIWYPRRIDVETCGRGCHTLYTIGRITEPMDAVRTRTANLSAQLAEAFPDANHEKHFRVVGLADDTVADVRRGLLFLLGAVGLVLLIACANVANLLLVRGETRRGEVALRAALGASRMRIVGQVLMESVVLTAGGVAVGLALARLGIGLVHTLPTGAIPRIEGVALDGRVLAFTLGLAVAVVLLFGLSPAIRMAKGLRAADLVSDRRGTAGPAAARSRSILLAVEVALSVVLLVGAGLMLRSFDRLYRVDMGFAGEDLTRFRVSPPGSRYDTIDRITTFYDVLEERLQSQPGVVSVGSAYGPPLGFGSITGDALIEGRPDPQPGEETYATVHSVTTGYIETMQLGILRGRAVEATDRTGTLPVAVVSETFVRDNFPDEDPLGKRFRVTADFGFGSPVWTIVGIARDVRRSPTAVPRPDIYVPLSQYGPAGLTVTMRTRPGAAPTAATIQEIVRSLDARLPVIGLETVEHAMRDAVAPTRFYFVTMMLFAVLAVVLACVGLYGVVAYVVSRRGREIGIRMALGARGEQVVRLMLRQGLLPAGLGMVAGLLLALALGRVAESLLFQVSPRDPLILAGVTLVLGIVTFAAALLPAVRASRVDPATALRIEGG